MPQQFNRTDRIAQLLLREIATLLNRGDLRDPRISSRTRVTEVVVSRDLAHAKVFVLIPGEAPTVKEQLGLLNNAAKELRMVLSSRLNLRTVPRLKFHIDTSVNTGERITELLRDTSLQDTETSTGGPLDTQHEDS